MKKPKWIKSVRLLGAVLPVVEVKLIEDRANNHGRFIFASRTIEVKKDLMADGYLGALLHEAVHAGGDLIGIDFDESQTDRLSTMILSLIRDNPKLVKMIRKGNDDE